MRALSLALRGLWWRRAASLAILVLGIVCTAIGAAGPAYLAGARDAVVQTNLSLEPAGGSGTGVVVGRKVVDRNTQVDPVVYDVGNAFSELIGQGVYAPPIGSVYGFVRKQLPGQATIRSPMVYRQGECAHIRVVSGRCVSEADAAGVLITAPTARRLGVGLGGTLPYTDFSFASTSLGELHVRGIYEPVDPGGAYWFASDHGYFGFADSTDAVLAPQSTWTSALYNDDALLVVSADLALHPQAVDASRLETVSADFQRATARLRATSGRDPDSVTTDLSSAVRDAQLAEQSLTVPVAVVSGQLVVLTIAVLFLVMVSSAESRTSELTLGKLHGLRTWPAVLHAVLEPALLLAAAVPAGVGLCALVLQPAAAAAFGPAAHPGFGALTWLAAVAAGFGGLLATVIAAASSLRRPVLEQWRRTQRRPGLRSWIIEAVVVVAAVGGGLELASRPVGDAGGDVLPLLTPALLAVGAALVGARVVPLIARGGAALTRARRWVPTFVAMRQMARRRDDMRVFGLLCVTVALLVFGLASQVVFDRNRVDRARADVGADRVVVLANTTDVDVAAVVDRLDPSSRLAAAVYQGAVTVQTGSDVSGDAGTTIEPSSTPTTPPTLLVVDPARFAAVGLWRADYTEGRTVSDVLSPLRRDAPAQAAFRGTTLRLAGTVRARAGQPVELRAGLTTSAGVPFDVSLGSFPADDTTAPFDVTVSTPECATGCGVRRLSLFGFGSDDQPLIATVRYTTVTGGGTPLLPVLLAARWTALNDAVPVVDSVRGTDGVVELDVSATAEAYDKALGFGGEANVAGELPGVVTGDLTSSLLGQPVDLGVASGNDVVVDPNVVTVLPRAGDAGVVVSRAWLAASRPEGSSALAPNQIWLSSLAPADFPQQLAAAGVPVGEVESVHQRADVLARQGPSFAVTMLVFGSVAAALLAVAGTSITLFVAARRRLFELAALRALGLSPRKMWLSLAFEHVLVAALAAAVGFGAGLVGARLALASVPEFADRPAFPPLLLAVPVGRLVLAAVVVAVAVGVVTALGDVVLVRRADVTRLREAQT